MWKFYEIITIKLNKDNARDSKSKTMKWHLAGRQFVN